MLREYKHMAELGTQFHTQAYTDLKIADVALKGNTDIKELADAAYAMHKLEQYADAVKKLARTERERIARLCCMLWVRTSDDGEPIRTEYVTASPNIKTVPKIPKKHEDPELYKNFLMALGVSEEMASLENPPVAAHWPDLVDYCTNLAAQGKPLPPALEVTKTNYDVYELRFTEKRKADALKL